MLYYMILWALKVKPTSSNNGKSATVVKHCISFASCGQSLLSLPWLEMVHQAVPICIKTLYVWMCLHCWILLSQVFVLQAEALEPFPDLTQPEVAFPEHPFSAIDSKFSTRMGDVYLGILDMEDLLERARQAVISKAEELAGEQGSQYVGSIVLDLPCTFFMLRSVRWAFIQSQRYYPNTLFSFSMM